MPLCRRPFHKRTAPGVSRRHNHSAPRGGGAHARVYDARAIRPRARGRVLSSSATLSDAGRTARAGCVRTGTLLGYAKARPLPSLKGFVVKTKRVCQTPVLLICKGATVRAPYALLIAPVMYWGVGAGWYGIHHRPARWIPSSPFFPNFTHPVCSDPYGSRNSVPTPSGG